MVIILIYRMKKKGKLIISWYLSGEDNLMVDGHDENNDKVDGVNVYYDQIDEVVYLVKIILEEMEGKDHGESS